MVRGGQDAPPGWVKGSVCSAYCHSDSKNLIDYRESDTGTLVVVTMTFGIMMIDMLFNVAMTFGVMMVDVLFHYLLAVMAPFVIAIPVAVPVVMAITIPSVMAIPVTIPPAMMVAVPVWIPFALVPSVMMSMVRFVAVVIAFVIMVSFAVSATICPCVAAQSQYQSYQNDSYEYELPCHVNLLYVG